MAELQIYLARNQQQAGPYTLQQLNQMLAQQQVIATDLIWHQGMTEWKTIVEVTQGQSFYQPSDQTISTFTSHTSTPTQEQTPYSAHTPAQDIDQTQQPMEVASIAQRLAAKIIDLMAWLPIFFIPSALMPQQSRVELIKIQQQAQVLLEQNNLEQLQQLYLNLIPSYIWYAILAYIVIMLAVQAYYIYKHGQSLGKKIMMIMIVDANTQQKVGVGRGFFIRSFLFIIIYYLLFFPIPLIVDLLPMLFNQKSRTIHDYLAQTIVVKKRQ